MTVLDASAVSPSITLHAYARVRSKWFSGPAQATAQLKLISAARKIGTIKRFFPSEYGGDYPKSGPVFDSYKPAVKASIAAKQVDLHLSAHATMQPQISEL